MFNIDAEIFRIESSLNRIFDRYKNNDYFENIEPANIKVLIYKNSIKFIPMDVYDDVQTLLNILSCLEEEKSRLTTKSVR